MSVKTVKTRGDAWLQKLPEHLNPDFSNRSPIWCKYIHSIKCLDIEQASGYALQTSFSRVDETIMMEEHTCLVIARQRAKKNYHGKPFYDIKLIYCDGEKVSEISMDVVLHAANQLQELKHITSKQAAVAKTNTLYACALYCFSIMHPDAGKRFDPSKVPTPLSAMASRQPRRRITRIAEIEEQQQTDIREEQQTAEEFQP